MPVNYGTLKRRVCVCARGHLRPQCFGRAAVATCAGMRRRAGDVRVAAVDCGSTGAKPWSGGQALAPGQANGVERVRPVQPAASSFTPRQKPRRFPRTATHCCITRSDTSMTAVTLSVTVFVTAGGLAFKRASSQVLCCTEFPEGITLSWPLIDLARANSQPRR